MLQNVEISGLTTFSHKQTYFILVSYKNQVPLKLVLVGHIQPYEQLRGHMNSLNKTKTLILVLLTDLVSHDSLYKCFIPIS